MTDKPIIHDRDGFGPVKQLDYEKAFFGNCFGVALVNRTGPLKFVMLVEDDGSWHVSKNGGSTYWFPDILEQMQQALMWMETNCDKGQWGYALK